MNHAETQVADIEWRGPKNQLEDDKLCGCCIYLPTPYGIRRVGITVLNRMTGFGHRDVETGFRETDGRFWLASGYFDIRECGELTAVQAIEHIKKHANNCRGEVSPIGGSCFDIRTRKETP